MYAEKFSMAHSLELRGPFLDKDIVKYTERLPAELKVRNGMGKWLHKRICRRFLLKAIVARRKRGFATNVVDSWFRDALGSAMANTLEDESAYIFRFLRLAAARQLCAAHAEGRRDNQRVLFSLIVLVEWLKGLFVGEVGAPV